MSLSPFGNNEEESRRSLGLLAGDPQINYQQRGALWEVIDGPPISEADEPIDSNQARLIRALLRIVDSTSATLYDPLRDTPIVSIEMATLGERIWFNGVAWNEGLIQETIEFHEKYGPLVRNENLTAPPVPVMVIVHWLEVCRLALAFLCYESMRPEGSHLRSAVIEHIIYLFRWDISLLARSRETIRQLLENRLIEWSHYRSRYDITDQDGYTRRANTWLKQTINLCLEGFGVRSQIEFSPPNSWLNSYVAPSLGGAVWSQLAAFILEGSAIKRCKYELCQKKFAAKNSRKEYCSTLCKENRKKRERRSRGA